MGILDWLNPSPSPFSKAHSLLIKNNLIPQARLLKRGNKYGYTRRSKPEDPTTFTDYERDREIKMLVAQKVDHDAAGHSWSRFTKAVEICEECEHNDGVILFKQFVNLYEYYISNYGEVGGPTTW